MISDEEKFRVFVGPAYDSYAASISYINDYQKYRDAKKRGDNATRPKYAFSFHVWAFLFTLPWMLYRKLYIECVAFLGAIIVIPMVLPQLSDSGTIGAWVAIGILGKQIYAAHVVRSVRKIERIAQDELSLQKELEKKGGTSLPAAWIGGLLFVSSLASTMYFLFMQKLPGCNSEFFTRALEDAGEETVSALANKEGMENAILLPPEIEEMPSENIDTERLCSVTIGIQNDLWKVVTTSVMRIHWRDRSAGMVGIEQVSQGELEVIDLPAN